jgi:hypothetical protein
MTLYEELQQRLADNTIPLVKPRELQALLMLIAAARDARKILDFTDELDAALIPFLE